MTPQQIRFIVDGARTRARNADATAVDQALLGLVALVSRYIAVVSDQSPGWMIRAGEALDRLHDAVRRPALVEGLERLRREVPLLVTTDSDNAAERSANSNADDLQSSSDAWREPGGQVHRSEAHDRLIDAQLLIVEQMRTIERLTTERNSAQAARALVDRHVGRADRQRDEAIRDRDAHAGRAVDLARRMTELERERDDARATAATLDDLLQNVTAERNELLVQRADLELELRAARRL